MPMRLFWKIFFLLFGVGIIPLIILSSALSSIESTIKESVHQGLLTIAHDSGSHIERSVLTILDNLEILSKNSYLLSENDFLDAILVEMTETYHYTRAFNDISFLDTKGNVIVSINSTFHPSWIHELWFTKAQTGKHVISDVFAAQEPFRKIMTISVPVTNEKGNIIGVLVGEINLAYLARIIDEVMVSEQIEVYAVNNSGQTVLSKEDNYILQDLEYDSLNQLLIDSTPGTAIIEDDFLAVHYPISWDSQFSPPDWSIVIIQPSEFAYKTTTQVRKSLFSIISICFASALLLSFVISKHFSKRINALLLATKKLGENDFSIEIDDYHSDEIGSLAKALVSTSKELQDSREMITRHSDDLEIRVKKRTLELESVQSRLINTAHMAGMAEVATGILHNIGNINTSINVRLEIIKDGLEKLNAFSLADIVEILEKHKGNLDDFFENDPRGQKIFKYLALAQKGSSKHIKSLQEEVDFLFDQLSHINDIIILQQRYSKGDAKLWEKCKIGELLNDATHMLGNTLNKRLISLTVDIPVDYEISVNRPQLVQVLVNLIKNASESISAQNPVDKNIRITQFIQPGDENYPDLLAIRIADTGQGIPPDLLGKIFSYGFTTKKDGGTGYGLHYCSNYIQSIGGRIEVESDGLGQGAVFILYLPIDRS